mmetsp:Transcript_12289/g.28037  ORF Transcript_12289/g.28037 Transcript_12289/m.28037 type:complete len:151 (+) Transcript_12289:1296-1748(+)
MFAPLTLSVRTCMNKWTCTQDALFDLSRWESKGVRFRESSFLSNERAHLKTARIHVVSELDTRLNASADAIEVLAGSSMDVVAQRVRTLRPDAQLVEIRASEIVQLCKWLGTSELNRQFNRLAKYVLSDNVRCASSEWVGANNLLDFSEC